MIRPGLAELKRRRDDPPNPASSNQLSSGVDRRWGIDLDCVTLEPSTLFFRNLMYDEFDVFEMSVSETLLAIERDHRAATTASRLGRGSRPS
jgi:hypothetical protein